MCEESRERDEICCEMSILRAGKLSIGDKRILLMVHVTGIGNGSIEDRLNS